MAIMTNSAMPMQPEDELSWIWKPKKIQKPDTSLDQNYWWKKLFIASCLCALLVDPLFFYIPILKDDIKCIMLDPKLKIAVLLLRSITDLFYLVDIITRIYRSENYSGLLLELNRRENQMNFNFILRSCMLTIAKTIWASNDILIDIVALLPLPQVAVFIFFSKMSDLRSLTTTRMVLMNVFALLQNVPRVFRIYFSSKELKKMPLKEEEIRETPIWIKGVLNFSMYIIASHVVGALWYFFAIQRMMICWHSACRKHDGCDKRIFGCHDHHFLRNITILNDLCLVSVSDNSSDRMFFNFGIFATVLKYGVVGSTNYFKKFLNCFWWGLRHLSSVGSNLEPSDDGWENLYTIFISISGLLLFLYLIGNLQMYMQFETTRREDHKSKMLMKQKMEEKGPEIALWLFKNGIPTRLIKDMKLQIMEKVQQALEMGMDTNLDNILPLLPSDVRSRIQNSMPLPKLKLVPMLREMDEGLLKLIYQKLEPVRYNENSFILQKGEPLEKMLYIVDGDVSIKKRSYGSDDSKRGAGELCGEELLRWPFSIDFFYFHSRKPWATESVKAIGVVEALALNARDLKSIYYESYIAITEEPRHKKMMKEEMKRNIDWFMPRNGIPEKLNQDIKSWMMKMVKEQIQNRMCAFWDLLPLDWDKLVSRLPLDKQNVIKSYMPLTKLKEIPSIQIQKMEESVLKELCRLLRPMKYNRNNAIIEKSEPIQMLLIVEGGIGYGGCVRGTGEIYGEELLVWPSLTSFPDRVPTAAESLFVITDVVEVLVLTASDMTSVATEFRKHFIKNYGRLVQNLRKKTFLRCFTEREVEEATRNYTYHYYNNERYGTIYHTKLDGRGVVIKKCNSVKGDPFIQSQRLVHEAFVHSQIEHKNVVRLFGSCLETRWPVMIYVPTNALTLLEHFHRNNPKLSFESRMKIAAETAGALAYLHSRSVIHRDVKAANIFINDTTHTAKVFGFGASRLLDEDEGEMEDEVSTLPGTSQYLDPEYLKSHVLTKKSDVYSFGVVLVELLTHQEAFSTDGPERSLANKFVCSVQEDRLGQMLDGEVIKDEFSFEMAKKMSELAVKCLRPWGVERPSMEEVAAQLKGVAQTTRNR